MVWAPLLGRAFGRQDLGQHAAGADMGAGAARHPLQIRIAGMRFFHQFGLRVPARVGGMEALLVGEYHQAIGFDQIGDQRRQGIVVPQPDFIGRDRIVLVDDGHALQVQQGAQRGTRIEVAGAVGEVFVRQQHLGGMQLVAAEDRFVGLHQAGLAHGGGSLQLVDGLGPPGPAQALHAFGDGAAGNQHHLLALSDQARDLLRPARKRGVIQSTSIVGDQGAAHFHHHAPGLDQHRLTFDRHRQWACFRLRTASAAFLTWRPLGQK